jgi:hypothetical protein
MWNGPIFQTYYLQLESMVRKKLEQEKPAYLLEVDFDEYLEYLIAEFRWEPLEWYEDQMTIEPFTVNVERVDRFFETRFTETEPRLRLRIPISPHAQRDLYFDYGPSTTRGEEPDWKFEGDVLVHEVAATERGVEQGLDDVRFWLRGRNKEIEMGNGHLRERIRPVWEAKRRQLEEHHNTTQSLLQKLNIPLHQDPNARAKPVEIKPRQLRTVVDKPTARLTRREPTLSREDVGSLVNFIDQYVRQFEVSPKTYAAMGEEELRDLLVGMMNTNYPGSTTAETFSKLGKTDISLRVDSGHVLVCECKFWSGAKAYGEAIDQLFDYLTWRQNYGVLIHFCKLKEMSRAVSEAKRATSEHGSFTGRSLVEHSETRFTSRHFHPQDADKLLEVHHLFIDLSV